MCAVSVSLSCWFKSKSKERKKWFARGSESDRGWRWVWSMQTLWFTPRRSESLVPKILTPLILSIFMISSFCFLRFSFPILTSLFFAMPSTWCLTLGILDFALTNFVRDIRDPEHPYSLEQLSVLSEESITVDDKLGRILWVSKFSSSLFRIGLFTFQLLLLRITFTPTVQHCSMATVIGLCLRVKLKHYFPPHYKVCSLLFLFAPACFCFSQLLTYTVVLWGVLFVDCMSYSFFFSFFF